MTILSTRRTVVAAIGTAFIGAACRAQQEAGTLTPEQFGAKGDGVANDTAAFARLAAAIVRRGGGTVVLRKTTYIVGAQQETRGDAPYRAPAPIFGVTGLRDPLRIVGNNAVLRCAGGLRYGSFDPVTGRALAAHRANYDLRTIATPYQAMISVIGSRAAVEISDLELDGNSPALTIGGSYGDVGIQIGASGIYLKDNLGDEILTGIRSHRHGQDGLIIDGVNDPAPGTRRDARDIRCEDNGRQGCSLVGGIGWSFERCHFVRSGRGSVSSPPGAGLDVEAEGAKRNRDHRFVYCSFVDNAGCGMVADTGDSADLSFTRCLFVGTTAPSIWPNKPGIRFIDCRIVGTAVDCFGDPGGTKATRFTRCLFTDNPALAPRGIVYRQGRADGSLVDLSTTPNVQFDQCRFLAVGGATLPWSTGAIYRDCTMKQRSRTLAFPRGWFVGRNVIVGPVDLNGSRISGTLIVNGARRT